MVGDGEGLIIHHNDESQPVSLTRMKKPQNGEKMAIASELQFIWLPLSPWQCARAADSRILWQGSLGMMPHLCARIGKLSLGFPVQLAASL